METQIKAVKLTLDSVFCDLNCENSFLKKVICIDYEQTWLIMWLLLIRAYRGEKTVSPFHSFRIFLPTRCTKSGWNAAAGATESVAARNVSALIPLRDRRCFSRSPLVHMSGPSH